MKILELPLGEIRTDLAYLKQWPLAPAIGDRGPLVVVEDGGRYLLVDGFKRLSTLRARGEEKAWVQVVPGDLRSAKAKLLTLNSPRKTATLYEEILVLQDLSQKENLSEKAIARLLGRKVSWVRDRLLMARRLGPELRELVAQGKLRIRVALGLAELPRALAFRAALAIERDGLTDKEAREFLELVRVAEDPDPLLAQPRQEMVRLFSQAPCEDPRITRLRRIREDLGYLAEEFSNPPQDPGVFVELKRVAWAVAQLAPKTGKLLDSPRVGEETYDTRRHPSSRTKAQGDGALPTVDRPTPQAVQEDRSVDPLRPEAPSPPPAATDPGSLPGPGAGACRGGSSGDGDLPPTSPGGVPGRPDRGGRVCALDPAPAEAAGLRAVRNGSRPGGPNRLDPTYGDFGQRPPPDPPLLDDPLLEPVPVPGGVPG